MAIDARWREYLRRLPPQRRPAARRYLQSCPAAIQRLILRCPPGTVLSIGGRTLHVVSYHESLADGSGCGFGVSPIDPAIDYDAAIAAREYLCTSHVPEEISP